MSLIGSKVLSNTTKMLSLEPNFQGGGGNEYLHSVSNEVKSLLSSH